MENLKFKKINGFLNGLLITGFIIVYLGVEFKIMHWPGSDVVIPFGLLLLSLTFLLISFTFYKSESKKINLLVRFINLCLSVYSIGMLFKLMHYPGADIIMVINFFVVTFIALTFFYFLFRTRAFVVQLAPPLISAMLLFLAWGITGYFLRVSKSVLYSFVAINDEVTYEALAQLKNGDDIKVQITENKDQEGNVEIKKIMEISQKIDELAAEQIKYFDALKLEILNEIKEEPKNLTPGPDHIITTPFDPKFPLKPIRMNLVNITGKDRYDETMRIFGIDKIINKPSVYHCKHSNTKGGIDLWNNMQLFRGQICSLMLSAMNDDTVKRTFADPKIVSFRDLDDLHKSFQSSMKYLKLNPEQYRSVEQIYIYLSKNEYYFSDYGYTYHWLSNVFDHSPVVGALASLSNLQKEVLTARFMAQQALFQKLSK